MNSTLSISIGVLAQQTGCTVPTIRYYEEIGLLPIGPRSQAGRRLYADASVRRLNFIRRCRDFGFSIEQVRELVSLVDAPGRPCVEARDIAATHLRALREKLSELQALEASMSKFVRSCESACMHGAAIDCTLLEDLGFKSDRPPQSPPAAASAPQPPCCEGPGSPRPIGASSTHSLD